MRYYVLIDSELGRFPSSFHVQVRVTQHPKIMSPYAERVWGWQSAETFIGVTPNKLILVTQNIEVSDDDRID